MRVISCAAAFLVGAAALGSVVGHAAGSAVSSGTVGAGATGVGRCDTDGYAITQNLSGSNVTSVTIGGISSACGGGSLQVNVDNNTSNSSGSGTVPSGGGTMTVSLATAVAADASEEIDVTISGP